MAMKRNVQYHLVQSQEFVEDSGVVTSYGIRYGKEKEQNNGNRMEPQMFANISIKQDFVESLIDRLINHAADPVHLRDLIDDFLYES